MKNECTLTQLDEVLQLACDAAREAGSILREAFGSTPGVQNDDGRDVKLDLDVSSEQLIVDRLRRNSSFNILAEEGGGRGMVDNEALHWVVDPLDGSVNFFRGLPLGAVSIGLRRGDEFLLGVVYDFHRDELFSGLAGRGAVCNGSPVQVSGVANPRQAVLCTGFPVLTDFSSDELSRRIGFVQSFKKVRMLGSAALSLAYVACGRADAYDERDIQVWDVAAGLALVQAAGGRVRVRPSDRHPHALCVHADNGALLEGVHS
jgi:myo-inositol-1(or 4)-monophosphatase